MSPQCAPAAPSLHAMISVQRSGALSLLLLLALGCGGGANEHATPQAHQIIIVDVDSLRADHLGCYGYQRATSPNIDALAATSVRFDWTFAQAPNTAPSQASILTGLYPTTHRMVDETTRLSDEVVTLAEAFAEAGFSTAAFVDGGFLSEEFGFAQGFTEYDNSRGAGIAEIGPKALHWLEQHTTADFLLLIHAYDPHVPYAPPSPHQELFTSDLEPPTPGFSPTAEQIDAAQKTLQDGTGSGLNDQDLAWAVALYDGEIHWVDAFVGELHAKLDALGLASSATIVLVSDHGEEFQEHGDLLHEQLYTTVTRVPLLLHLPGGSRQTQVIGKNVETVDLLPTLLELAGLPVPSQVQGQSLLPLINGQSHPPYLAFGETTLHGGQRFVALGGVRLLDFGQGQRQELYDLTTDPKELVNLIDSEPEKRAALSERLEEWSEMVENASIAATQDSEIDQATLDQLKGLGYIQ